MNTVICNILWKPKIYCIQLYFWMMGLLKRLLFNFCRMKLCSLGDRISLIFQQKTAQRRQSKEKIVSSQKKHPCSTSIPFVSLLFWSQLYSSIQYSHTVPASTACVFSSYTSVCLAVPCSAMPIFCLPCLISYIGEWRALVLYERLPYRVSSSAWFLCP